MQTLSERVSYLKGLADGAGLNEQGDTEKILAEVIAVLEEVARAEEKSEGEIRELNDRVNEIDEDLGAVESDFYGDEADNGNCENCNGEYEVECPQCRDRIVLNDETAAKGEVDCPNCGAKLQFDLNDDGEVADSDG